MGTNQGGISRYNGSEFSYLNKETGLTDNVVYALAQDRNGRILIGTNNGLNILSGTQIDSLNTEEGLPHKGVVSILISQNDRVWLGTGKGPANLVGDKIVPFTKDSVLSASTILNIREGIDGAIWFCTVQNGLFKWDGTTMQQINSENGLDHDYVYDVMPMGKYDAWIFGYKGLYRLKNTFVEHVKVPDEVPSNASFFGYQRDKAKNIWIGTSYGVLKFSNGKFGKLLTTKNGLVSNNIWKILQDREGNMWFGSKSVGVSKLNSERFKIYRDTLFLPNQTVNAVMMDRLGKFWLGTNGGLAIWNGDSHRKIRKSNGLNSEEVSDIAEDANGTIYVGTNYGLSVFKNGEVESFEAAKTDLNECQDVYVDGSTIWLGTKAGPAIFENGQITQPYNSAAFPEYVFDAVRQGNMLWFAYNDGALRFDGKRFKQFRAKDGFFDGRCRSVVVGPNGHVWFGTNNGIYCYDGKECRNYSVKDGLIADAVYSLGFARDGSLWVGQANGISRLLFQGKELEDVLRYGKEQGFMGLECGTNSLLIEDGGKIWVGTTYGLVEYDPSEDKGVYFKPLTRITAVKLYSQDTDWLLHTDSVDKGGIPINLELPYDKNHVTFEFTGVSLTSAASINYSWILEGFDEDWSKIQNRNSVPYQNLPPGKYVFKVRAGYGDELSKNEPVSFSFIIRAPFYRTTWFYLICAAIAIGIAYSYYTIRRANVQITRQKQEIEQQKDVIEKKNNEMVDSINYASTIQSAILPSDEQWFDLLPDSFVFYKPKDIVSGDFYWLGNAGDEVFFAAVDCTGHGVPGALMSIVGYNGLNQAINEHHLTEPASILNYLSTSVNESLRKSEHDDYVRDGMDIALCRLNPKTRKLAFAGAFNPLLIIRNNQEILIKGDRIAIGSMDVETPSFVNHEMVLEKGDRMYIYSDGYADQFGGKDGKKMKTAVMRQYILSMSGISMANQRSGLEKFLGEWKGKLEQVDDICVIGVSV